MSVATAVARIAELQSLLAMPSAAAGTGGTAAPTAFADSLSAATAGYQAPAGPSAGVVGAAIAPAGSPTGFGDVTRAALPADVPYGSEITAAAQRHGVDPALLAALIKQESGFDPNAHSPAGAQGLTQLMPGTAAGLGVSNPLDPAQAIEGGAKYLAEQLKAFGGDEARALAAYNAGPGAVQRFGGVPPYAETQNYVRRVQSYAAAFRAGASTPSTV
jgi:soluble lytic murein transglycosylase-like protein